MRDRSLFKANSAPSSKRSTARRHRRLFFEQFEDRRMLAVAVDDSYSTAPNTELVVQADGAWSNDSYNASWDAEDWECFSDGYSEGYWDHQEWHEGYWDQNIWGYYHQGYWEKIDIWHEAEPPEGWHDGYYDLSESNWHDGYYDNPGHDGYYEPNDWHPGQWTCFEGEWVASTHYASGYIASDPPHGRVYPTNSAQGAAAFTYVPNTDFVGTDSFVYWIADDAGIGYATVTIRVGDHAPNASDDSYATDEDTPLVIHASGVLANDSDPDSDALTASFSGPSHGSISGNADGSFTYTPAANFNGTDSFAYFASDGVLSSTAMVTITVNAVNDAPVAVDDFYVIDEGDADEEEDSGLVIDAGEGVLANDGDVDNGQLSAILVLPPRHGELTLNPDGSFTYIPDETFRTLDAFTYRASDGALTSKATVFISEALGRAFSHYTIAVDDTYSTANNTVLPLDGITTNDVLVPTDAYSILIISGPSHGTLAYNVDGALEYTPAEGFSGLDSFTYNFSPGGNPDFPQSLVNAIVTIRVGAPTARDDTYTTTKNVTLTVLSLGVLANDTDPNGTSLSAGVVSNPAHGSLTLAANGSFTYVPDTDFSGFDSFTYRASAGNHTSDAAVRITVNPVSSSVGLNFTGMVATNIRADTDGAVGPSHIVELLNSSYSVYDKSTGRLLRRVPLAPFWQEALAAGGGDTFVLKVSDPRIIFDPASGRWFASAIATVSGSESGPLVLAVSNSADPMAGWKAFSLDLDPNQIYRTDFDMLGVTADGVYINSTNTFFPGPPNSVGISRQFVVFVPKDDLLSNTPTVDNYLTIAGGPRFPVEAPVMEFFGPADGRELLISDQLDYVHFDAAGGGTLSSKAFVAEEVQELAFADPIPAGSTFTISLDNLNTIFSFAEPFSITTNPITYPTSYDALALSQAIQDRLNAALEPYQTYRDNAVFVSAASSSSRTFTVTFGGEFAINLDQMTVEVKAADGTVLNGKVSVETTSDGAPLATPGGGAFQPGVETIIENFGSFSTCTPYREGNNIWLAYDAALDGRSVVRWINVGVNEAQPSHPYFLKQTGIISDPQLDFLGASLAINPVGDVVIGFTGAGSGAGQYASTYAVVGNTNASGYTTFGNVMLLKAGGGSINDGPSTAFGDYSATVIDPQDPYDFWTFQEYAPQEDRWGIGISQIHVAPPAGRPIADDDFYTTNQDTQLSVSGTGVLANDTDPTNDSLTVRLVQRPSHGTLTLSSSGTFVYTPHSNYRGVDTFTYWALDHTDSQGNVTATTSISRAATVTIAVDDSPPSVVDLRSYSVAINSPTSTSGAIGGGGNFSVLESASDPDGDMVNAVLVGSAPSGLEFHSDGTFAYTPPANFTGIATFTFQAFDGFLSSNIGTINIYVFPKANDDEFITPRNTSITITPASLLANDQGPSLGQVRYFGIGNSSLIHGDASVNADGTLVYEPFPDFKGVVHFDYDMSSNGVLSNTGTVTIYVGFRPIANNDNYSVAVGTLALFQDAAHGLLHNDIGDGVGLGIASYTQPSHGSASVGSDGSFTYTHSSGYHGTDSFTYTVTDGLLTAIGTVTVAVDSAPRVLEDLSSYSIAMNSPTRTSAGGVLFEVLNEANDNDGDPLTAALVGSAPPGLEFHADGTFAYTPPTGFTGIATFAFQAFDGFLASNIGTVNLYVYPIAHDDQFTTSRNTPITITTSSLFVNDQGPSLGQVRYWGVGDGPSIHGTAIVNADGSIWYEPNQDFTGIVSFTYDVLSNGVRSNQGTVTIYVS